MELSFRRTHGSCAYLPSAMKLRQGNVFTSICQEFCPQRGGGHLPQHMLGYWDAGIHPGHLHSPRQLHPPQHVHPLCRWAGTPPEEHPPGQVHPLQYTPWAGTPPLGRSPPARYTHPIMGRYTPQDGHCSGRYASYWNAFLLLVSLNNQISK